MEEPTLATAKASEPLRTEGLTAPPEPRPPVPFQHLRNCRDVVLEAAQQQRDELVEEGVAVPQVHQPAPHHASHRVPHLHAKATGGFSWAPRTQRLTAGPRRATVHTRPGQTPP